MSTAMDIYNAIGEEIEHRQSDLNDLNLLIAYADPKDAPTLRDTAHSTRDLIAGLNLARSIAYRHAMTVKETS